MPEVKFQPGSRSPQATIRGREAVGISEVAAKQPSEFVKSDFGVVQGNPVRHNTAVYQAGTNTEHGKQYVSVGFGLRKRID